MELCVKEGGTCVPDERVQQFSPPTQHTDTYLNPLSDTLPYHPYILSTKVDIQTSFYHSNIQCISDQYM